MPQLSQADPTEFFFIYIDLRSRLRNVPANDKIVILGDFNAREGRDADTWKGVLGKHGIGNCNENGYILLELWAEQQLRITNTVFQQKDRLKTTWMHARSKHWHMTYYILVRQRDLNDVAHTRVTPSAECHTDHSLLGCAPKKKLKVCSLQTVNHLCGLPREHTV